MELWAQGCFAKYENELEMSSAGKPGIPWPTLPAYPQPTLASLPTLVGSIAGIEALAQKERVAFWQSTFDFVVVHCPQPHRLQAAPIAACRRTRESRMPVRKPLPMLRRGEAPGVHAMICNGTSLKSFPSAICSVERWS